MDKITKYYEKGIEEVEDRVLRFIGSTEDVDRDGEVIRQSGWQLKNYKKHPVVLINHMFPKDSIGYAKTKKVWVDQQKKALMFDIEFPPPEVSSVGDSLYKFIKWMGKGATSVSFMPNREKIEYPDPKKAKGAYRIFNEQDLLEISLVSVPANQNALLTSKSLKKAIDAEVIDELEANELETWFKGLQPIEEKEEEKQEDLQAKFNEELLKATELLQQKLEEIDSKYDSLFKDFRQETSARKSNDEDSDDEDSELDDLIEEILGEINNE